MSGTFGRVICAMVTPFNEDGQLDPDEAQRLARHLVDEGCDGLVLTGSTGESSTLDDIEKVSLYRAVKDAVGADAKVIAGTGSNDTAHVVDLSTQAEKAGADGLLLVTPYYVKPPQDALLAHFVSVADATGIPVLLYDIPGRTSLRIEYPTLLQAAEHPRIRGLKESCGDWSGLSRFLARAPDDFELYSGNDDWTLPLQALGADGVVSVAAHVVAGRIREQLDAFEAGDVARAREIHDSHIPLVEAIFCSTNPIPIKAAVEMLGFRVGAPRGPLREASSREKDQIREALETVGAL